MGIVVIRLGAVNSDGEKDRWLTGSTAAVWWPAAAAAAAAAAPCAAWWW